jgi:hypothetical protein
MTEEFIDPELFKTESSNMLQFRMLINKLNRIIELLEKIEEK